MKKKLSFLLIFVMIFSMAMTGCNKTTEVEEEIIEIMDFIHNSTRGISSLQDWSDYIQEYEEALKNAKTNSQGVQLITMHACKGLEFHSVFLPDCNEGKIPHKKAGSRHWPDQRSLLPPW